MATKNTTKAAAAAAEEEKILQEPVIDERDAEIERLKAELENARRAVTYSSPADDLKRVRALCEEVAKSGGDAFEIKVPIRVPRRPANEDQWYWINVNGRSAQIPADDKVQELRLPWAEVLLNMIEAEERAKDFADSVQVFDPVTNPHPV